VGGSELGEGNRAWGSSQEEHSQSTFKQVAGNSRPHHCRDICSTV
jgi:hypothetical protein